MGIRLGDCQWPHVTVRGVSPGDSGCVLQIVSPLAEYLFHLSKNERHSITQVRVDAEPLL